jgi:hypothetical protein
MANAQGSCDALGEQRRKPSPPREFQGLKKLLDRAGIGKESNIGVEGEISVTTAPADHVLRDQAGPALATRNGCGVPYQSLSTFGAYRDRVVGSAKKPFSAHEASAGEKRLKHESGKMARPRAVNPHFAPYEIMNTTAAERLTSVPGLSLEVLIPTRNRGERFQGCHTIRLAPGYLLEYQVFRREQKRLAGCLRCGRRGLANAWHNPPVQLLEYFSAMARVS